MRIGINTRNLIPNKMEGFGHYTFEIVSRLISNHPEHEFILFFDRPIDPSFTFGPNAQGIVLSPPTRHPILYLIWFEIKLPRALKKHKIDPKIFPIKHILSQISFYKNSGKLKTEDKDWSLVVSKVFEDWIFVGVFW